jgi:hypothetical protein
MKEFANQLHEEFAQFDEATALFEIKMTGKNLRAEAAKTGAIAGMEFEMIVPNVAGGDEDAEPEPDWDYDESVGGISDAVDFFDDAGQNSRRDLERLRERMQESYHQWLHDQFQSQWESDDSEFVFNYIKENAVESDLAEILGLDDEETERLETEGVTKKILLDATEKIVADGYSNRWYNDAYENAQEEFINDADQESEWLEDQEINSMQEVMNTFGVVDWPYWNTPSGGDRSIEDVANDFQDAIGIDVQASGAYHSGAVDRPSTSSHHYVVEPDGSLTGDDYGDRGLEFVSPPLPIDVILNDLNKVKRWADSYGCYTNDSTGLHINISVPDYSRDKLDFVKLAILMGDEYVSDSFGRLGAFYAKSAMGMIRDNVRSRPEAVADALEKMRTHMNTAASKAIHAGVTQKFTSINVKDGHIEFRSPGGDWLGENFDKIENTLLRFTVAMSAALNPEMYREEYLKKLYKILNPEGQKDEYGDMIQEFSKYMASLQGGGAEASGKLSKETQQAIKAFRTAASKELKQTNLANKLKKGDTGGQRYWWNVSWGNGRVEVVATTKEEAIETAFKESYWAPDEPNTPQAKQFKGSLRAKPLSPYYEKSKPSVWKVYGSNSSPYQRLGVEVVATDEFEAMQKARQKWNLNVGGRTEEEFFSTNGWSAERIGDAPAEQTTKYEIYNKQTGNLVEPADGITNDADALIRLNDYIEHGPHALQRGQASRMFGIRTTSGVEIVDIDIPMAQGRAATSVTGQWKIVDGLNRELYRFRPAENTRAKANELAALWARENNFDGNYQVEPAEDTATGLTPDQQQGGLIDVAGSTTDLARQRATPGTFTGAWRVLDADGNELHRFSGVGNVQSDANRVAVQWMRSNGYDQSTDISVVPVMSESIAEGLSLINKIQQIIEKNDQEGIWDGESLIEFIQDNYNGYIPDEEQFLSDIDAVEYGDNFFNELVQAGAFKQNVAEGKLIESAVFLNPTTVIVGQAHGQPLELSPNTLKQIQAIAAKHGAWYEGNGTDRGYTKGQIDRYVGSWDDEVAKIANSNDPKWLYVLFANVDANNRVQRVGVDPKDTIFNRLLATAKDNSFQGIGYTPQALQKFLQMASEGQYDFVKMSQQPATQENLTRFLKAGEALMWPSNWEQYPNKAGKIAKAATVDVRDQYLATRKAGVYVTGSGHLKAVQNITGKQGVAEGADPDKKYTIKKSYTMSKSGVEKSVWYIMDGDFVVDVTDFRRDAKYYADKWNAAEKESSNASQNQHKQGVAEGIEDNYNKNDAGIKAALQAGVKLIPIQPNNDATGKPIYIHDNSGRYTVAVDMGGISVPFYNSTGLGGKAGVAVDKWYPFFGIGPDGWINKGSEEIINDFYGSNKLKRVAQVLNNTLGLPSRAKNVSGWSVNRGDGNYFISAVNRGLDPAALSDRSTKLRDNMLSVLRGLGEPNKYVEKHTSRPKAYAFDKNNPEHVAAFDATSQSEREIAMALAKDPKSQGVAEGLEFFSMPLRMSEYRGKHHPATNEPYDAKFKFSGDLKDRVHSLLDAGTKPTLLQVNPRHLLATQDWLSTQGGGKPPFATMKQHPVVLQKNNKLYILDGHHRSADALKAGAPIQVYLFKDEL